MLMHEGQLTVTSAQVAELVADQFPRWASLPVTAVRSSGTVTALFRLGDELVARFPFEQGDPDAVRAALEREGEAARTLAAVAPCPVPVQVALGGPGDGYPQAWSVHRWLPGTVALDVDVAGSAQLARDVAGFVAALRTLPTGGATFAGRGRGGALTSQDEWVAHCLEQSAGLVDTAAVGALWAELRTTPRGEPDGWTHNDLMPGNLLVDERGRLAAVIDVGGAGVADPAVDLQPAWNLFTPEARAAFRAALQVDDAAWDRGRGWALVQALGCLWYYVETNPTMSAIASRTLAALLDDRNDRG
jgi:aminoglycoside phosphotransferase (APT) family kinase protein